MDGSIVICSLVVIGCVFWAIINFILGYLDKEDDSPPRREPPKQNSTNYNSRPTNNEMPRMRFGDENIYGKEWDEYRHLSERDRDRLLGGKIQQFWDKALEYSIKYIEDGDIDSLYEFLSNIWNTRDLKESADDLHTLTEDVIERLYPYRDNPQCRELIYTLCRLVLSNADNYIAQKKRSTIWRTPTKLAILLEKDRRYDEAIEVCDFCIARRITDWGYGTFKERKERLLKKARR